MSGYRHDMCMCSCFFSEAVRDLNDSFVRNICYNSVFQMKCIVPLFVFVCVCVFSSHRCHAVSNCLFL